MSLKARLSLSIVALVAALVTVLSAGYARYLLGIQLRAAGEQAGRAADRVQAATQAATERQAPLGGEDSRVFWRRAAASDAQLRRTVDTELGSMPFLAEIAVTDEKGEVLVSSANSGQWPERPALKALLEGGFIDQWRSVYAPRRDYEVSRALAPGGEPAALVVRVAVSTAALRGQLQPQFENLGTVAGLSVLAAAVLAVVFSRIAFRPLDALGQAIDRMTRGEFAPPPAPPAGGDEYAALTSKLSLLGQQFRDAREGLSSLRGNVEQLMRRLEDAVLLFGGDGRLVIANTAAEGFLRLDRRQLTGRKLEEIFAAETELGALVQSAAQLRQPIWERLVAPARALVTVEVMEGGRGGTLVILRDAETRRQIETQVEVSTRLAAISRLTGGVAHEIKNPLNGIALYLDLLKNRLAASEAGPAPELDVIVREVARLDRVVKTFLDFTRPVELRLSEVRLGELLAEVAGLARPQAAENDVRIEIADAGPDATVRADTDLLKQAVLNLAVNGIQAMLQGGELRLGVARVGRDIELSVSDQGGGIPPEIQDQIFNLYFTTRQNGSGIGLAMTYRVVQLHNGTIEFSTEVGRGTVFRVRLPAADNR